MHFKIELVLCLWNGVLCYYCTNDVPWGELKCSVHPSHSKEKHTFPLPPCWCLARIWVICYRDFCCQPDTMELRGILFASGSFHPKLFPTKDKNSKNWPQSSAPLCIFGCSPQNLYLFDKSDTKAFLNCPTLRSKSSLCYVKPWIHGRLQNPVVMWLFLASLVWKAAQAQKQGEWCAFLNKPETLSPEMELWLCGCTDWVVGGRRTYVYCKLRQILSSPV